MKFDSRFTIGNLISIVVMLVIAVGAVVGATSHTQNQEQHPKGRASADNLESLRMEMANGFREQRIVEDSHHQYLSERIDGLYKPESSMLYGGNPMSRPESEDPLEREAL